MVELAWLWQRYQPDSANVRWYRERAGTTGARMRKVMVGTGAKAAGLALAVRHPRLGARRRGNEAGILIGPAGRARAAETAQAQ